MRKSSPRMLSFSQALDAAKAGHTVRRSIWETSGLSLVCQEGLHSFGATLPALSGIPSKHFRDCEPGEPVRLPCLLMTSAIGALAVWVPTQPDMFADDWCILEA